MPKIFVSYSRVDTEFTERIVERLRRVYGLPNVWYDDELHGGQRWWQAILAQIAACDVFVYLLSNESVTSPYCQAEFTEARRLQKPVVTVQIRDRTRLSADLTEIQYVDMKHGLDDNSLARLIRAINELAALPKKRRALWTPATPLPVIPDAEDADTARPEVTTPTLHFTRPQPGGDRIVARATVIAAVITGVLGLSGVVLAALMPTITGSTSAAASVTPPQSGQLVTAFFTSQPSLTQVAQGATETPPPTTPPSATFTVAPTDTRTPTPLPSQTPSEDDRTATLIAITRALSPIETQVWLDITLTALRFTETPTLTFTPTQTATQTPNATGTYEALLATAYRLQTMEAWTDTPTPTLTFTPTPTFTPTMTFTPTPTPDPLQAALAAARSFSGSNADWQTLYPDGYQYTFDDGVPTVLVPAGCFMMGSNDGSDDEQPVIEQCFDAPFWIDRTEVTQADFERLGGVKANDNAFDGAQRPVERITWFEARDFCAGRGARLPTEAEWEYAARGPDALIYPWGDTWNVNNAVWNRSDSQGTANVSSIPSGRSWVGAYDLSGNVWEWVSSLYLPYDSTEDHEADTGTRTDVRRVLRGGSWYVDYTFGLRSADRGWGIPGVGDDIDGFRCARSASA